MAKNYVAKTFLRGNKKRVLSNSYINNGKTGIQNNQTEHNVPMNIGILNKENLDMSAFKEFYAFNDKEKKHPYYVATVATPGYKGKVKGELNRKKINVGDYGANGLTFINIDDTPVGRLGVIKEDTKDTKNIFGTITNEDIDMKGFSMVNKKQSYSILFQKGFPMYYGDNYLTDYFIKNSMDLMRKDVFDGYIRGIPPIKAIDPQTKEEYLETGTNTENYTSSYGYQSDLLSLGSGEFCAEYNNYSFQYHLSKVKNDNYTTYTLLSDCPSYFKGFKPVFFSLYYDGGPSAFDCDRLQANQYKTNATYRSFGNLGFSFLYDGKDYWMLTVNMTDYKSQINKETEEFECIYVIGLMKIQDIPSKVTNTGAYAEKGIIYSNFTYTDTPKYINEISKMLQVVEPVKDKYDGDGPDPVGPGDPYEGDAGNAENSTPTKPNMKEDITLDNADPNEHFNQFMVQSGIFGGYLLTPTNLQRYSSTLEMLYENSKGILHGADASFWADRLQNSVTGLFMLPFNALDGAHSTVSNFVVGNTPVATNNDFQAYTDGTNYSPAALITKPTYVTEVDMGYLNENYDNFMDFASHSKVSLYNPYHNKVELPLNLIQSTSSQKKHLKERIVIDIYSGNIMYMLFCDGMFISHWTANCAKPIPLSVSDVRSAVNEGLGKISALVGATTTTVGSLSKGGIGNTNMGGMASAFQQFLGANSMSMTSGGVHMIGNDSVDGSVGWLGEQDIILTVERAEAWRPDGYGGMSGYPTKKIFKLAEAKGLVEVEDIKLKCNATDQEKQELKSILAGGILL